MPLGDSWLILLQFIFHNFRARFTSFSRMLYVSLHDARNCWLSVAVKSTLYGICVYEKGIFLSGFSELLKMVELKWMWIAANLRRWCTSAIMNKGMKCGVKSEVVLWFEFLRTLDGWIPLNWDQRIGEI